MVEGANDGFEEEAKSGGRGIEENPTLGFCVR
jgi:hypothetical protein